MLVLGGVEGAEGLESSYWFQIQCSVNLVKFKAACSVGLFLPLHG